MTTETRSQTFPDGLLRDWSRTIGTTGTLGTDVSLIRLERSEAVKRFERSEAIEPFDRTQGSWNGWNWLFACVKCVSMDSQEIGNHLADRANGGLDN